MGGFRSSNLYFYVFFFIALLKLFLNQSVLNIFEHYTVTGGSFLEKFHPATYLEIIAFAFLILNGDLYRMQRKYADLKFMAVWLIICVYLGVEQKWAYMSVITDEYLFMTVAGIFLLLLNDNEFNQIYKIFFGLLLVNLPVVVVEYIVHHTLLPTPQETLFFRPCGLLGHPIMAGYMCCVGLLGARYYFSFGLRRIVMLALIVEIALCGVRGPLVVGLLLFIVDLIQPKNVRRADAQSIMLELSIVCACFAAVLILAFSGSFQRVLEHGLWDQSAQSRFTIVDALGYLQGDEWLFGVSAARAAFYSENLNMDIIENSVVLSVFIGGLLLTIPWLVTTALYFWQKGSRNYLFLGVALAMIMTSLGYSVKGQIIFSLLLVMELIERRARSDIYQAEAFKAANWDRRATHYGR